LDTDKAWKRYGEVDPYFGVVTHHKYHSWILTDQAREEFFRSGEAHVRRTLEILREIDPAYSPSRAMDFGCGVGRVALPLARESTRVLGVDVAPGMLSEARKNAAIRGIANVTFAREVSGSFDLVHSFIVLQHIPPRRGVAILRDLVARVEAGGMIVLQLPYRSTAGAWRRLAGRITRFDPLTRRVVNLVRGRRFSYPTMTTFCYDVGTVFTILRDAGFADFRISLDAAAGAGYLSMTIYGQKSRDTGWQSDSSAMRERAPHKARHDIPD
jgi:SAM-dependent methyltransferase